jgi:hypothetical protein
MKRRLLSVVAGLSLALCVASAALWVRSYHVHERLYYRRPFATSHVAGARGPFAQVEHGVMEVGWAQVVQYEAPMPPTWQEPPGLHRVCGVPIDARGYRGPRSLMIYTAPPADTTTLAARLCFARRYGFKVHQPWVSINFDSVTAPMGAVVALTGAFPAVYAMTRLRRRRRRTAGRCRVCGYDLRATPDRCPECGAASREKTAPSRSAVA